MKVLASQTIEILISLDQAGLDKVGTILISQISRPVKGGIARFPPEPP